MHASLKTPAHGRIYYGWRVVAALFVVGMMVYGAGLYAFTLFIPPLTAEFGWSRAATGGLVSIFWLAAPLSLFGGAFVNRFGAARLISAGILIEGGCMILVGFTHSLSKMFLIRALMGLGKIMMACGVMLQASIWFKRRYGMALAICYAGWHFGGLVLAPIAQLLLDHFGWRDTSFILGGLIILISFPPLVVWGRVASPATLGLHIDGMSAPTPVRPTLTDDQSVIDVDSFPGSLLRTRTFCLAVAITILGGFAYGGLLTHEFALISGQHIEHSIGAAALSLTAAAALVGALTMGYFCDRVSFSLAMLSELALMGAGVLGFLTLIHSPNVPLLFVSAALFGISVGGFDTCLLAHIRRRGDGKSFSNAFGVWYFAYLATLFLAPIIVGKLFDRAGQYVFSIELMIGGIACAMIAVAMTPAAVRSDAVTPAVRPA